MSFNFQSNILDGLHKAPGVLVRDEILRKGFGIVLGPLTRTLHQERHAECPGHSQGSWV